jgi:superfamily II DNA or RNA helicase
MIVLPNFLKSFQSAAQKYLDQGYAKELLFSNGTYQVQILDPDTQNEEWVFLQFDSQNRIKDSFCSCKLSEEGLPCIHQAIAILRVFGGKTIPLHQRFAQSLWNAICMQLYYLLGNSPKVFKEPVSGEYVCEDADSQAVLRLKGTSAEGIEKLRKILFERSKETEETSIKFSNLSEEELLQWQKGRPPQKLAYELSFWSDLAKWWWLMQEIGCEYTLSFQTASSGIPTGLRITFADLGIEYHFSEAPLAELIPTLATVDSPLAVHEFAAWKTKQIRYDKARCSFAVSDLISTSQEACTAPQAAIDIGEWTFLPGDGFYSRQEQLFPREQLKDVETALNTQLPLIKERLAGAAIYEAPTPLSYELFFDAQWNLHFAAYLFTPGDLSEAPSHFFNTWAYIDQKGFYRVETPLFEELQFTIAKNEVADFVSLQRSWLNTQKGFKIHISPIRSDLDYTLTANHSLLFSAASPSVQKDKAHEFGPWIYVETYGFFPKLNINTQIPLNIAIPAERVPDFIRSHRAELQFIKNFFSECVPVAAVRLSVCLHADQLVLITPEYEILPEYQQKRLSHFGEFVFVEEEGFYELPPAMRLPEKYWNGILLKGEESIQAFLEAELPAIQHLVGKLDTPLLRPRSHQLVSTGIEQEKQGYLIQLKYETELGSIPVSSLWDALRKKKRFLYSEAGMLDLQAIQFQWLASLNKESVDRKKNVLALSALELLRIHAYTPLQLDPQVAAAGGLPKQLFDKLTELRMPEIPDIRGLKSELRSYQQLGLRWLWFLQSHGLSGLLCDDMGLGKTHQAMALLIAMLNAPSQEPRPKMHFLILCPTSVIFHWQEKLQTYLPEIKVCVFHGSKRSLDPFMQEADILLTSYGIWKNELERLSHITFDLAIFDELQLAKNQNSRLHRSLLTISAKMRLGLTGTPIENRLRELKALFDIVLPSYMPVEQRFREQFVRPIEKEGSKPRRELLSRLVKPFILRRKKEDVLVDLPEKIEEIAHCELLSEQLQLYQKVLQQSREMILADLEDDAQPIPYLHIFTLFSHLKQISNHPASYLKKPDEYLHYHSGKWELFKELLEEARESGQKVVVFSQFLMMLDIIQLHLKKHKIGFSGIRGSTTNRAEQLQRFNHDPKCTVFVASLQAAGLGIDLTAGSVVIHYDRWWNAARENQATDRVHRIGQTRGVQVFKLVTKDTIEEHIDRMILRKGKLMEEMIGADDHQMIKTFSRQEILELLQIETKLP